MSPFTIPTPCHFTHPNRHCIWANIMVLCVLSLRNICVYLIVLFLKQVIQHLDFSLISVLENVYVLCLNYWRSVLFFINRAWLQKVERVKSPCLQYAAATQWLISPVDIPKLDELFIGPVRNSTNSSRALNYQKF